MLNEGMLQGAEVRIKCTFCPAEAEGDLSIEVEQENWISVPICEDCLPEAGNYFNMIDSPK
jgi:hypothetical protein